ncbi:MAG TPA: elongation factor G, partial [Deltaproteobacteria bacterium]|nr:elongation factor G [Deltaproteobacteria bacterium]
SAYKNKGIQCLLDAVTRYLPSPLDIKNCALDIDRDEAEVELVPDPQKSLVALAFKLEAGKYGQLTYLRIYQGKIEKGNTIVNSRTGQKVKVGRVVRMHADQMEDIEGAEAGDIIGLFGIDCFSGDTFTDGTVNYTLTSIHVPSPVISLSIKPKDSDSKKNLSKALQRFAKEDPTFRTYMDHETKETIISGMGELHLEVYLERMKREYGVRAEAGKPKVAYRETISRRADFDYTHKKQTGGAGQFARVAGFIEPCENEDFVFESQIRGGVIPTEYIPACEKGFRACLKKGSILGFPIVGVKVTIDDGTTHPVDSSELAFQQAAIGGFRKAYEKAKPIILEPLMRTVVETPREFQGVVLGSLNQRRGIITSTSEDEVFTKIEAEVPLSEMFGYSSVLRSLTQGKAEFTMEFSRYQPLPASKLEELKKELAEKEKK